LTNTPKSTSTPKTPKDQSASKSKPKAKKAAAKPKETEAAVPKEPEMTEGEKRAKKEVGSGIIFELWELTNA
jgi:hypothetical protein